MLFPFSGRFFTVKLPVALDPGAKISVIVEAVYTHVLQPYPTQITQSEKQFVVFEGNHYFYSPYPTKTQSMRVKLASRNVESYTKLGNPTRTEDLLDYGPFRDVPAYSQVCLGRVQPSLSVVGLAKLKSPRLPSSPSVKGPIQSSPGHGWRWSGVRVEGSRMLRLELREGGGLKMGNRYGWSQGG